MEIQQKSEFNDAIGFLNRCNQLFYLIDGYSSQLDMYNWFHHLRILYKELSPDMPVQQRKDIREKMTLLISDVNNSMNSVNGKINFNIVEKLDDIEIELRILFDKCGYQKKVQDDPRFAK